MSLPAKVHKPFLLLSETMKSYDRVLRTELGEHLSDDYIVYLMDVDIVCIQGLVCLPVPSEILILDNVIEHNGADYFCQTFKLICDPEIV